MMSFIILGCEYAIVAIVILVLLKVYAVLTLGKCQSTRKLHGKTALVTGSNRGIGYITALDLAKRGARVIITSENKEAIVEARDKIISITGNRNIVAKHLDLLSLQNVRDFAKDISDTEDRLDILVNNAGTTGLGSTLTKDGILPGMQVNYLGPFLLTNLLLALLKKSSGRIVNVASVMSHAAFDFNSSDLNRCFPKYNNRTELAVYSNSKLCVALTTKEMAKKLQGTGVTVNCLHPGAVYTKIFQKVQLSFVKNFVALVGPGYFKTPEEGAQTTIFLSVCESVEGVTGKYFSDCRESRVDAFTWWNKSPKTIKQVWDQSVLLTKLSESEMHYDE